jgi:hypothetical protein
MNNRYDSQGKRILEYNDTHIFRSGDWAVNEWDTEHPHSTTGPCITHWCYQPVYTCDAWNYVVSPNPGNKYWALSHNSQTTSFYRCTECGVRCLEEVQVVFDLYVK